MKRVGDHPVLEGASSVRWLAYDIDEPRAGTPGYARLRLENAGSAPWPSQGRSAGVQVSYRWLDPRGNPIVWDAPRTPLPRVVEPGDVIDLELPVVAPRPPGDYRLAFDLLAESGCWFTELGSTPLDIPTRVAPRISERLLGVIVYGERSPETEAALAAQEEPISSGRAEALAHLAGGALPAPDWSRLLLDAHQEGYGAVGGAVFCESHHDRRKLRAWAPLDGRNPQFEQPLLFPSLLEGLEVDSYHGLPAYTGEDALYDGRAVVTLPKRSGLLRD